MERLMLLSYLAFFVVLIPLIRASSDRSCRAENRHHAAYGQWANRANNSNGLSMLIPSLHHHAFRTFTEEELLSKNSLPLAGSTECPTSIDSSIGESVMGRSLCPWFWKVNYDPRRIPAMLPEAQCRCRQAVTESNGAFNYECQPMTMQVRVLQIDPSCEQFQERTIEIAVACVSVFQSTVRLHKVKGVQRVFQPQYGGQMVQEIK